MTQIHITQGEYAIAADANAVISTLLGSCVSCCLWDPVAQVGGMNHILLAGTHASDQTSMRSGVNAMEVVINALIKRGAERQHLKAKAFGGARMVKGLSDIGEQNAKFVVEFLREEGIPLETHSFGGIQARNVKFWPASGRVMQKLTDTQARELEVAPMTPCENDVELF